MAKHTVLIVDDENDLREAICSALVGEGFECLEAQDGKEGLEIAVEKKPDLILLDIMMPNMNGHEMLEKLRMDVWGRGVKVIQLTVLDDTTSLAKSTEHEVDDYIVKSGPTSLDDIVKKVKEHLAG